ncbi:hypothetical protein F5Y08DRAFT_352560 [Xylaria arbuscula]|nr:hypothetical protein F5Y08DRAFT_352560 [Xylaria arbuscula]
MTRSTIDSQYRSIDPEEQLSDSHDDHASEVLVSHSTEVTFSWRPFYLRRAVLLGFIAIFILVIITIESLLAVSNRYGGIATSDDALHYLWTLGPTAFLTGLAAFWARTEYQSKLIAPWMRLSQDKIPASRTLLLDYISPFSILTITRSWRNQDYTVFISIVVSIIIKILITLSSALITLSPMNISRACPMVLQDRFINSNVKLLTPSMLAPFIIQGLGDQNITLPEGISSNYAYQSVQTNLPNTTQTQITVDGLINSVDCEPVDIRLLSAYPPPVFNADLFKTLHVAISSTECNISLARLVGIYDYPRHHNESILFARFDRVQCDNTATKARDRRVLILFGNLTYHDDYPHESEPPVGAEDSPKGVLHHSAQLLCSPSYAIEKVQVTRNSTQTNNIMPIPGSPQRTLSSVTSWDIMDAHFEVGRFDFYGGPESGWDYGRPINISGVPVDVDTYMDLALNLHLVPDIHATSLFDPQLLHQAVEGYYRQIGGIIAKESLMEPALVDDVGSALVNEKRLVIRNWVAQWMVGLLSVCVLLTAIALFLVPRKGFLPYSPSALLNLLSVLQHSRKLMDQLSYAGASDDEHLRFFESSTFKSNLITGSENETSQFYVESQADEDNAKAGTFGQISSRVVHPTILHPISRSIVCVAVAGLIIALELILYKSNVEDGLGDVGDDEYIHYTWTSIPALIFGALSLAFSATDFETRNLTPYLMLKQHVSGDKFRQLDYLDMALPKAIYRELNMRTLWAFAITTAFLIASLFTTISASLFQESIIPVTTSIVLRPSQSFDLLDSFEATRYTSSRIASFIFQSNYSFPRFTYKNLAFPELVPVTVPSSAPIINTSTASISTTVPAIRSLMDCRLYDSSQISVRIAFNETDPGGSNPLSAKVYGETCDLNKDKNLWGIYTAPNTTYIGQEVGSGDIKHFQSCSDLLYFWAKIDYKASPPVQHIAALGCNTTFETVDCNTTFTGANLDLDLRNPPRPLESTARNSTINRLGLIGYLNILDNSIASVNVAPQALDNFFSTLVTSPWAIPISALGDPAASANITSAIKLHHGIITAQALSALRVPANQTNVTLAAPIRPGDNDGQSRFNATVVDTATRRRVVQDAVSTHVLVALLATALVLFIVGWVLNPGTSILPRNPTTIASAAALLAGGNLFAHLPTDGSWLTPEAILTLLGRSDARFWMGWGNLPDEEGRYYGGENEAGVSRFGIFVVDKKADEK